MNDATAGLLVLSAYVVAVLILINVSMLMVNRLWPSQSNNRNINTVKHITAVQKSRRAA